MDNILKLKFTVCNKSRFYNISSKRIIFTGFIKNVNLKFKWLLMTLYLLPLISITINQGRIFWKQHFSTVSFQPLYFTLVYSKTILIQSVLRTYTNKTPLSIFHSVVLTGLITGTTWCKIRTAMAQIECRWCHHSVCLLYTSRCV